MRVPVVDVRGVPLMPCTPPKARALLTAGKAGPKRNKLGRFSIQLADVQDPRKQILVVGIDPGSQCAGLRGVGTRATGLNRMVEAPTPVKEAVKTRSTLRRTRRYRVWRRPCRSQHRLLGPRRLPPATPCPREANPPPHL